MKSASFALDPSFRVGDVDQRLFGAFVEHMGRCVYTGIYEPDHPEADHDGFRQDVLRLVRELGPTVVRYPGGNFVSSYRWEDGIGPKDQRPRRLDLAWHALETNQVGVDEFVAWCRLADASPMMALNLGTRGIQEAVDLVEYCNHPSGTALSDLRRSHGSEAAHDIRLWCLGNELDGRWQVGHKTADEYGRLAAETGRAMRLVDPTIELVACGSSHSRMPTFASWEASVLRHCHEVVDYVSLHCYYEPKKGDVDSFLASGVDLDRSIDAIVATADHVAARQRSRKRLRLSVDEWNVWYQSRFPGHTTERPEVQSLIEDRYNVTDAVVVGSLLITLLRHADRVAIACQAQLVNVIAPIMTEPGGPAWRQTIYHPFAQAARWARGSVLHVEPNVATYETALYGEVPLLDATATYDSESGDVSMLAVNRSRTDDLALDVDVRGFRVPLRPGWATTLHHSDPATCNTRDAPGAVAPRQLAGVTVTDGRVRALLPPLSWNVIHLETSASGHLA